MSSTRTTKTKPPKPKGNNEKVQSSELWLLHPYNIWKIFCANPDDQKPEYSKLFQRTKKEMDNRVVTNWHNESTYEFSWFNILVEDGDEPVEEIGPLVECAKKVRQSQLYLNKLPAIYLFYDWSPSIKMGFAGSNYSSAELIEILETKKRNFEDSSLAVVKENIAINSERKNHIISLNQSCSGAVQMLQYKDFEVSLETSDSDSEHEDSEQDDGQTDKDARIIKKLQFTLTSIMNVLIDKKIMSPAFKPFLIKLVNENICDTSNLNSTDLEFLVMQTGILRQREVDGKRVFVPNDLDE